MRRLFQMSGIFALSFTFLYGELRSFTNDFGDTVEAELIELKDEGSIIEIRLKNGSNIDAPLAAFNQDDQKYIRQWWKGQVAAKEILHPDARLRIGTKLNRKSSKTGYNRWYSDDQIKSFFPEVVINNQDLQQYTGNEVRIVIFAEDKSDKDQILVVSASSQKADFEKRAKAMMEGEPFRLRLYEYKGSSRNYEYGYEYCGYAIKVKNSKGEVTHEKASKSKYLNAELFYKCKAGEMYDVDFERKLNAYPSSYYVK